MEDNVKLHERVASLETNVEAIMTNHLPHIQEAVDKLSAKFWALIVMLIANLVSVITGLFFIIFK